MTFFTNYDNNNTKSSTKCLEYVEVDTHKNCHIQQRC